MATVFVNEKKFNDVEIDVAQDYDDSSEMAIHSIHISTYDPEFKHGAHYTVRVEGKNQETGEKAVLELKNFKFLKFNETSSKFFSPETSANFDMDIVMKPKIVKKVTV